MKLGGETGSTALEALVALALLTIACTAIAVGARGGISSLRRAQTNAIASSSALRLDDAVREEAAKIRFPYWRKGIDIDEFESSVSVPWYGGDEEKRLILSIRDETFALSGGECSRTIAGMRNGFIAAVKNGSGEPIGLEVRGTLGGRDIRVFAPFGSILLAKEAAR